MWILRLAVLMWLGVHAYADSWMTPTERRQSSPNQKWEAVITPATDGKSGAHVTIGAKGKPGTPFTTATRWMPVDSVLFDDGSLLVLDAWHQLGHGKVAAVHDRDGSVRWVKTLEELIGKQMIEKVQVSTSSIWWRRKPLEYALAKDGRHVLVTLIDENQLAISLVDGDARIVDVADLGDDPQRLFNRARALARTDGQESAAEPLLERALAKNPDLSEAMLLYIELLQRRNDHAGVVALIERVSPRWKTKDGYNVANVGVVWAQSLMALGRPKDAERVLRRAAGAAPAYTNPTIALATLLADRRRIKDADAVLEAFVARLFRQPSLDTYALADIAEYYAQRKAPAKALALYLKGYKRDEVTNQFLYASLATLQEELGNNTEAIRVNEQLLAYFKKMGSAFKPYQASTEDELTRLRAKRK